MNRTCLNETIIFRLPALTRTCLSVLLAFPIALAAADAIPAPATKLPPVTNNILLTAADFTIEKVGTNIPASAIRSP